MISFDDLVNNGGSGSVDSLIVSINDLKNSVYSLNNQQSTFENDLNDMMLNTYSMSTLLNSISTGGGGSGLPYSFNDYSNVSTINEFFNYNVNRIKNMTLRAWKGQYTCNKFSENIIENATLKVNCLELSTNIIFNNYANLNGDLLSNSLNSNVLINGNCNAVNNNEFTSNSEIYINGCYQIASNTFKENSYENLCAYVMSSNSFSNKCGDFNAYSFKSNTFYGRSINYIKGIVINNNSMSSVYNNYIEGEKILNNTFNALSKNVVNGASFELNNLTNNISFDCNVIGFSTNTLSTLSYINLNNISMSKNKIDSVKQITVNVGTMSSNTFTNNNDIYLKGYSIKENTIHPVMKISVDADSFYSNSVGNRAFLADFNCLYLKKNTMPSIYDCNLRGQTINANEFKYISKIYAKCSEMKSNSFNSVCYDFTANVSSFEENLFNFTSSRINQKLTAVAFNSNSINVVSSINLEARGYILNNTFSNINTMKLDYEKNFKTGTDISNLSGNEFGNIDRLYFTDNSFDYPSSNTFSNISTLYLRHRIPDFTQYDNTFSNISFLDFDKFYDSTYLESVLPEGLKTCRLLVNGIPYNQLVKSIAGWWEQTTLDYIVDSRNVKTSYNSLNLDYLGVNPCPIPTAAYTQYLFTANVSTIDYLKFNILGSGSTYKNSLNIEKVSTMDLDLRCLKEPNSAYDGMSISSINNLNILFDFENTKNTTGLTLNYFPTNGTINSLNVFCPWCDDVHMTSREYQIFGASDGFDNVDFKIGRISFIPTFTPTHTAASGSYNSLFGSPKYLVKRADIDSLVFDYYFQNSPSPVAACSIDKIILKTPRVSADWTMWRSPNENYNMFANCSKNHVDTPLFYLAVSDEEEWNNYSDNWTTCNFSKYSSQFANYVNPSALFTYTILA